MHIKPENTSIAKETAQSVKPNFSEGIVVPPGCDNAMLRDCGEQVHTYTPSSYTPYSRTDFSQQRTKHMMSGKTGGVSVPKNATPSALRSMADYLQQFRGANLCLDLWFGSGQKRKICGILLEIGNDFLVLGDGSYGRLSLIDLKPIRYINLYCK